MLERALVHVLQKHYQGGETNEIQQDYIVNGVRALQFAEKLSYWPRFCLRETFRIQLINCNDYHHQNVAHADFFDHFSENYFDVPFLMFLIILFLLNVMLGSTVEKC